MDGDQLAVALELVCLMLMPRQHTHHRFTQFAQATHSRAQRRVLAPGRPDGGSSSVEADVLDDGFQARLNPTAARRRPKMAPTLS